MKKQNIKKHINAVLIVAICGLLVGCTGMSSTPPVRQAPQPSRTSEVVPESVPTPPTPSPASSPALCKSDFVSFEMEPDTWLALLNEHCKTESMREFWKGYGFPLGEFSEEAIDAPNAYCEFQELGWRKSDGKTLYECAVVYQGFCEYGYMDRIFIFSRINRNGKWILTDYLDTYSPRRLSGDVITYVTAKIDYDGNSAAFLVIARELGWGTGTAEDARAWYSLDAKAEVLRHFCYGYEASQAGGDGWHVDSFWVFHLNDRMARLTLFYDYSTNKNDWNRETDEDYTIPLVSGQRQIEFEWNPNKGAFTLVGEPRLTSAWSLPGPIIGNERSFHRLDYDYRDWAREFVPELKELTKSTYAYAREWARERLAWYNTNPGKKMIREDGTTVKIPVYRDYLSYGPSYDTAIGTEHVPQKRSALSMYSFYPTEAFREFEDKGYGYLIYDTESGNRLFQFYSLRKGETSYLHGFPALMKKKLLYKAFSRLKIGDNIKKVQAADPVIAYYIKQFDSNAESDDKSIRHEEFVSIHLLSDGILKIEYERAGESYRIKNIVYNENFTLEGAGGPTCYRIESSDYL